jgi:hypothetical protein
VHCQSPKVQAPTPATSTAAVTVGDTLPAAEAAATETTDVGLTIKSGTRNVAGQFGLRTVSPRVQALSQAGCQMLLSSTCTLRPDGLTLAHEPPLASINGVAIVSHRWVSRLTPKIDNILADAREARIPQDKRTLGNGDLGTVGLPDLDPGSQAIFQIKAHSLPHHFIMSSPMSD